VTCPRGHRVVDSTGQHWTVIEEEPGLYRYVHGACEELENQSMKPYDLAAVILACRRARSAARMAKLFVLRAEPHVQAAARLVRQ
jgi:hypothetical protein